MVQSRVLLFTLIAAALCTPGQAQSLTAPAANANAPKVGAPALYPDPSVTRDKAETLNTSELNRAWPCPAKVRKPKCSYSQAHGYVPPTVKRRVYAQYGVDPRNHPPGEIDHFYPLCADGSNDITSLWFQPGVNFWNGRNDGYHEKDDLEAWMCQQIRANRLDAREAFNKLTTDWVKFYEEAKPERQSEHVE